MFEDPAMNEFFGEVKQEPTAKRRRPEEQQGEQQVRVAKRQGGQNQGISPLL